MTLSGITDQDDITIKYQIVIEHEQLQETPSEPSTKHARITPNLSYPSANLCQLSSDHTRNVLHGVGVSEETSWVGFDLLEAEASASVGAVGQDTGGEWAGHAADRATNDCWVVTDWERVGQCDPRWSCCTLDSLMDVGCGFGGGSIVAGDTSEGDVLM